MIPPLQSLWRSWALIGALVAVRVALAWRTGSPVIHFPILTTMVAKGAAVGPVCAYIAAWALLGLNRFLEPVLGPHVAVARFCASAAFPPLIGWPASRLARPLP